MVCRTTVVVVALGLLTAACTQTAALTPLNAAAQATGAPTLHYASGLPFGVMNVTMPDGETLPGEFRIDEVLAADGTNFHASANGPRTRLVCTGVVSAGHGTPECRAQTGAVYRLTL